MEISSWNASKCFMLIYFLLPQCVPATWRNLAQTNISAEFPSGKQPTTLVRRRISRFNRSITLISFVKTKKRQIVECRDAHIAQAGGEDEDSTAEEDGGVRLPGQAGKQQHDA